MTEIIEKIKTFVEEECKKPTSKYGYEPFTHHFTKVNMLSRGIANKLIE
jgi:hypothetical protein